MYYCTNGVLALLIVRLGMRVTCFIPSVHDVEHTVPATGDVCVGAMLYVLLHACACKPYNALIVCLGLMSVWDVCMGYVCLYYMLVHVQNK